MLKQLNRFFLLFPIILFSEDLSFSGNERLTLYFYNKDSFNFLTVRNIFDISLNKGIREYSFNINFLFLQDNEIIYDTLTYLGISKIRFSLQDKNLSLKVGDLYFSIGRGILFSTFDDEKVKFDRNLFGVIFNSFERFTEINLFSGFLKTNNSVDTQSTYSGLEVKIKPIKKFSFGLEYLMQNAQNKSFLNTFGMVVQEIYGLFFFLSILNIDFYSEYVLRHTYGEYNPVNGWIGTEDVDGKGFYTSISYNILGFGFNLGFKDYQRFNSCINLLPTLNKLERLLNDGFDEKGFEIGLNISPLENFEFSSDYSYSYSENQFLSYFLSEFKYEFESFDLNWQGKYGKEKGLEYNIESKKNYGCDIEVSSFSINDFIINLKAGFDKYSNVYSTGDFSYVEFFENAELNLKNMFFIILDLNKASRPIPEYENKDFWWEVGTGIRINNGKKSFSLSYVNTKGGLVCSGGVCRYEPSFKGYKLNFEINF